jgi:catechol 2,3-dioxygenase
MTTSPLDIENLIEEIKEEKFKIALSNEWRIPRDTKIGHIHLHVSNLKIMEEFYTKALGFDLNLRYMNSASFLAAGGYHHQIGINIWAGLNAPTVPEDCVELVSYSIILSSMENLKDLTNNLINLNISFKKDLGEYSEFIQEGISIKDPDGNLIIIGLEKI